MAITLEQLLRSRDERQRLQNQFMRQNTGLTLMVLTVVMPGSEKRNALSLAVAEAATEAIRHTFATEIHSEKTRDLETGFEGWYMLEADASAAKRLACRIEDTHPLGRLFDIDVFDEKSGAPISRVSLGLPERKCLMCDEPARVCMRAGTHPREEVYNRINQMVGDYESGRGNT